jgi:purine-binding chemotaxis protein CheW
MAEREFLTFVLGKETYALDILTVKEIRSYAPVTLIANAPDYVKGVLNLRGDIVPIIDLRMKFNVGTATYNEFTIVIMLHIETRIIGIVVDQVSDVFTVDDNAIQPPPEFGIGFDNTYLEGLIEANELMTIIVNINKLMTSKDIGIFSHLDIQPKEAL